MIKSSILLVEDDLQVAESLKQILSSYFDVEISTSAEQAYQILQDKDFSIILSDLKLPGISGLELLKKIRSIGLTTPFVMITAFGDIPTAVEATKLGATDFLRKGDLDPKELINKLLNLLEDSDFEFVCGSEKTKNLLAISRRVAKTDSTVLILGESGVGKEVLARYIHKVSPRASRPFVAVNMAAIPDTLVEAELFGYEKGAFTGAERRKPGKFEIASGGTLLLDEIGDMPLHLQPKVLRVIQEKKVERIGQSSSAPIKIDVRIISTTNKNIEKMVKDGTFREDLFYRLSVVPLKIPPLRERKEDIPPLVNYFISKLSRKYEVNISIEDKALKKIMEYDWPGNVRELQNVVERAFILSWSGTKYVTITSDAIVTSADEINLQTAGHNQEANDNQNSITPENKRTDFTKAIPEEQQELKSCIQTLSIDNLNIKNMEKIFIIKALERTGGNKSKAAQLLGITVRTLRNKLKELKLEDKNSHLPSSE